MRIGVPLSAALVSVFIACSGQKKDDVSLNLQRVTLPGGQEIQAEVLMSRKDMMTGMMFRTSLAPDRGLLFLHGRPGKYTYWMHNVRVPLDIIWMDKERRIVEISPDTPPCKEEDPIDCPQYGGNYESLYVLELAAGMAERYGLKPGQPISF